MGMLKRERAWKRRIETENGFMLERLRIKVLWASRVVPVPASII